MTRTISWAVAATLCLAFWLWIILSLMELFA